MSEEVSSSRTVDHPADDHVETTTDESKRLVAYRQLEGIDSRKMMTLVNHFIVTTTGFINRLRRVSEEKLQKVHRDVARIDVKLQILEAKLASIKGLENVTSQSSTEPQKEAEKKPTDTKENNATDGGETREETATSATVVLGSDTCPPGYKKYFKLLEMMVPMENVKLKCAAEGNDPSILERFGQTVDVKSLPGNGKDAPPTADDSSTAIVVADNETTSSPGDASNATADTAPVLKLKDDEAFKPYFKMLKIRVPVPHIKAKMAACGLDPAVIDMDPEGPSPNSSTAVSAIEDGE